ncbi:uncharacterized protein LOC143458439 [Clavelina lepadiformis]|uniref:uncharacterized protein LOC143458439 n=1 Tax=Clavelina lepadiformis TaxID=159417 RepID=UPI004041ADFD
MSGSYLDYAPSPVGASKYKTDMFDSHSGESFTSYSDDFVTTSHSHCKKLALPPRLSSTYNKGKSLRPVEDDSDVILLHNSSDSANLTMWEQWLVNKLQVERERFKERKIQAKKEIEMEKLKHKEKEAKTQAAQERHKEWLQEKLLLMKLEKAAKHRENKVKKEIDSEKKTKLKSDTEDNFKKWMQKYNEHEQEKRVKAKQEKEKELQLKEEKKKLNEEKYQQWLEGSKHRWTALRRKETPTPSYINPNPWIGPEQDASRRRPHTPLSQPTVEREAFHVRPRSFSTKRSSTPSTSGKGCHSRGNTTIKRTSSAPYSKEQNDFPLRFAGITTKSLKLGATKHRQSSTPKRNALIPQPMNGMKTSCLYSTSRRKPAKRSQRQLSGSSKRKTNSLWL